MNEIELVKGLLDMGWVGLLAAYIFRLDTQRIANEAENRRMHMELNERRSQDNNRWLSVFTGAKQIPVSVYETRTPTNLE